MSELTRKVLIGLVRLALVPLTTWLMERGIITSEEGIQWGAEIAVWVIAIGWLVRDYIRSHRKKLTGLAMPEGSTLNDLDKQMHTGATASVLTPPDVAPTINEKP
jgi:hypothetical protein